ncbi:MAG: DNA replication and repair protein RecF [Alphaproteobacteria bacterium MarineAlpha11_Bin1]|nr:MAG: DNA replication and repair protein RecF [Alphaproteobacteria bacterium MarineAlpha11_Bin1]
MQNALANSPDHTATLERCAVLRLGLTDFRSYAQLRLDVDARPVVLTGANGAGKTNLLEAISFLVPGRGLRRARMPDVTRTDARPNIVPGALRWAVASSLGTAGGTVKIGTGFEMLGVDEGGGRRVVRINGTRVRSQAVLGEVLAAVWLVPEMDRLFMDSAGVRRRFLDRLTAAFDSAHTTRLSDYKRAMRERTRLLREDRAGFRNVDMAWISVLEQRMAESGVALAAARRDFVKKLRAAFELVVTPFPSVGITLIGDVENWLDQGAALETEDKFRTLLMESRSADREAGRALIGPHLSDIDVVHLSKNRRAAECSTGEQKALLISIVLAHARLVSLNRGVTPLILMDEIVAHLDASRRVALFDEICAVGAQAWLTGTDKALFDDLGDRAQYFCVENAHVHIV